MLQGTKNEFHKNLGAYHTPLVYTVNCTLLLWAACIFLLSDMHTLVNNAEHQSYLQGVTNGARCMLHAQNIFHESDQNLKKYTQFLRLQP
jgi:hypothetical protein